MKARAAVDFEPEPRASALVYLCATHQAEFSKLGWLAPDEAEDGRGASQGSRPAHRAG